MEDSVEYSAQAQPDVPLNRLVTYRIARLHAKLNSQATRILKENGKLTLMQWRVLVIVNATEDATHSKIAAKTQIDGGQISRCVKSMIAADLLSAEVHPTDHRQVNLRMTPKSTAMFQQALPAMRKRQSYFGKALPKEQHDVLITAFDTLDAMTELSVFPD